MSVESRAWNQIEFKQRAVAYGVQLFIAGTSINKVNHWKENDMAIVSLVLGIFSLVMGFAAQDGEVTAAFLGAAGIYFAYKAMENGEAEAMPGIKKAGLICSGLGFLQGVVTVLSIMFSLH